MKRIPIIICALLLMFESSAYALSKYGSTGQEVTNIQTRLKNWGYYSYYVDGIYGGRTVSAVKSFQQKNGLTPDGVAGPATLRKIGLPEGNTSSSSSASNKTLLAMVINGEARGESYEGQVAVGAVILNRIAHPDFPDSLSGVVYQKGAFSCVNDSNWYQPVAESSKKAARDALNGWDPSGGAVYYINASKTSDAFMHSRKVIKVIGNHKFCV